MMQMVGSFAEFERAMLRERTKNWSGGRPAGRARWWATAKAKSSTADRDCANDSRGRKTAADAARLFGVHPATISRLLSRAGAGASLKYATKVQQ